MLDEVGLVDDVDEVLRFGDAPEHAVHAQAQLPFPAAGFTEHEKVGLAQICVGAARIRAVVAEKRRDRETPVPPAFEMEFRFRGEAARVRALVGMGGKLGIPPAVDVQAAGKLVLDAFGPEAGACEKENGQYGDGGEHRAVKSGAHRHQRTRFRPVRVNSLALRLVRNL